MALGARAPQVLRTIVNGARAPLIFGLAGGVVLSMLGAQLLRGTLYGLSPFDPLTYFGVSGILVIAALIATWIPARRATRVDPIIALRAN
jgi:ABC-type antimicrobial peptide transport system permease subunit